MEPAAIASQQQWTESDPMKIFAISCIGLAVAVAVLMLYTTPRASLRASFHDRQAMWGMLRRLFFVSIAGGNMGMGLWVAWKLVDFPWPVAVFWLMISAPIAILLLLRVFHFVDQDTWIGGLPHSRGHRPTTVYEASDEIRDVVKDIQNPNRRARALRAVADLDQVARSSL